MRNALEDRHSLEKACFQLQGNNRAGPTLLWEGKLAVRMTHEDRHLLTTNGVYAVGTQCLMGWGRRSQCSWDSTTNLQLSSKSEGNDWTPPLIYGKCVNLCYHLSLTNIYTCTNDKVWFFFFRKENLSHTERCKSSKYLYYQLAFRCLYKS